MATKLQAEKSSDHTELNYFDCIEASQNSEIRHKAKEVLRLGRLAYIMKNVADNDRLTWPSEMVKYGAQVLTKETMEEALLDLPQLTVNRKNFAFQLIPMTL